MGLRDWVAKTKVDIDEEGLGPGSRYALHQFWYGILRRTSPLFPAGVNIYDREWDVLLVLDGCRVDAMEEVAEEYEFLSLPDTHRSTGSNSIEWVRTTFTDEYREEMAQTLHITANSHVEILDDDQFLHLERVYEYGWDEEIGGIPAQTVTDAAIYLGREYQGEYDWMIVHYMQPHFPCIPDPIGHGNKTGKAWERLWRDGLDVARLWESYIANLRYVLDNVSLLLENLDAGRVILTSDHGNAKGEWGVYSHPRGLPLACLREVPWYATDARDTESRLPGEPDREGVGRRRNSRINYAPSATGHNRVVLLADRSTVGIEKSVREQPCCRQSGGMAYYPYRWNTFENGTLCSGRLVVFRLGSTSCDS